MASRLFAFLVKFFDCPFCLVLALIERFFCALKRIKRLSDHLFDGLSSLGYGLGLRVATVSRQKSNGEHKYNCCTSLHITSSPTIACSSACLMSPSRMILIFSP